MARTLPVSHELRVKEHRIALPGRRRAFYDEVVAIPGVRLIDPGASSLAIIPHADLVVSVTGMSRVLPDGKPKAAASYEELVEFLAWLRAQSIPASFGTQGGVRRGHRTSASTGRVPHHDLRVWSKGPVAYRNSL